MCEVEFLGGVFFEKGTPDWFYVIPEGSHHVARLADLESFF